MGEIRIKQISSNENKGKIWGPMKVMLIPLPGIQCLSKEYVRGVT